MFEINFLTHLNQQFDGGQAVFIKVRYIPTRSRANYETVRFLV